MSKAEIYRELAKMIGNSVFGNINRAYISPSDLIHELNKAAEKAEKESADEFFR